MFKEVQCSKCGGPVEGLQLTEEQRQWLDLTKEAVLDHMKAMQDQQDPEHDAWLAIAEPFLFLYGYMISREDKRQ